MCGIAGMMRVGRVPPEAGLLDRFDAALAHRGPDGRGDLVSGSLAMVQRRLAIIDLAGGDQPLFEPGGAGIIVNGEIYNYRELRALFPGAPFRTASDCEPPLYLYRRDGLHFAEALRGMYAIALHDPGADRLLLARDPFGIKPLYTVERDDGVAFASEPQALIAAGLIRPSLLPEAVQELLQLQFTTGRDTVFRGIRRVLPGETLVVQDGRIVERHRRAALPDGPPVQIDTQAALERLDAVLMDSVAMHQRSDVPYGLFLSGGIDSAAVLACMARLNDRPVTCFTAGFDVPEAADERAAAARLAASVKADHLEVAFSERDFWEMLPAVAAAMDDPAADYATLPTFKLAQAARAHVKVVLSGEGGDELFAGYGRYRSAARPWWLGGRVPRSRGTFDKLAGVLRETPRAWRDGIAAEEAMSRLGGRNRLQATQAADIATWLPNDLLGKLDRCLMAHALEGRTPFLDPVVGDFAFRLPDRLKIRDGMGKWLLRRWLRDALPASEPFARKQGFTVPVGAWIARHGAELGRRVARQDGVREIAQPDAVEALFRTDGKRPRFAAWTLLFYALWHRRHLGGLAPDGDVFDCLPAGASL